MIILINSDGKGYFNENSNERSNQTLQTTEKITFIFNIERNGIISKINFNENGRSRFLTIVLG